MLRTIIVFVALAVGWGFALRGAIYAACLYLALAYFRPEYWAWNPIFFTLNLSFVAGVFLIIRTLVEGTKIHITARNSLLVVFLLHALLSSAQGVDPYWSWRYWELFATTIVVSFLLTIVIQTPAHLRLIFTVIAFALGFEAAKQGWARLILSPGSLNTNPVPFLGDNNLVAVGMAMLMPITTALATTSKGWWKRGFQFLSIGVIYRGLTTYSRGGMLAICGVGFLQLLRSQHKVRAIAAAVVVIAVVVPTLPPEYWERMNTIAVSSEDTQKDESQSGRLHFWRVAIDIANDRPLFGVGHSAFPRAYNDYDFSNGDYGYSRAVHSAWFGVLAELGYAGFFLFITIVVTSLLACRRVRASAKRGEIPIEMAAYATALESALVAFIIGGTFVTFHYNEMLWHIFALTMALETVAAKETALARARVTAPPAPSPTATRSPEQEPDFVWG